MITSVIGTRPQYVKVKAVYDYCRQKGIPHRIVDTGQHYSTYMSHRMVKSLGLHIDETMGFRTSTELAFMSRLLPRLHASLLGSDTVLIYGDTNSSFCAALVCYKLGLPFGHVEAGVRCNDRTVPEEINRIFVDSCATWNFCVAPHHTTGVSNAIVTGDVEYETLGAIDPTVRKGHRVVLTLHRQANMRLHRVQQILNWCGRLDETVLFPVHHRLERQSWFVHLEFPSNVRRVHPLPYHQMVKAMAYAAFLITDSGSVQKTAPFFGKRCLVLREAFGWRETVDAGYARTAALTDDDFAWAHKPVGRDTRFYCVDVRPSERIVETLR